MSPTLSPMSPTRRSCLALGVLAFTSVLAAQPPRPRPLWTRDDLPPEHPARVQTWQLDYEIGFHAKGAEQSDLNGFHRKLDFLTEARFSGAVLLGGRSTAKTSGDPSLDAEAARKRRFSRVAWQSGFQKPPANAARVAFARHQHDVDYHVNAWSWLRNHIDPSGGEDTAWSDTDEDRKVKGDGTTPLTVAAWIEFDMETKTYELQLSITDAGREQPLTVTSRRTERTGDHNGADPVDTQDKTGKLPLDYLLDHKCQSAHWHGYVLQLQNRSFPEGVPESFTVEFTEPMTSIAAELCPVGGTELVAKWLEKHKADAQVSVRVTISRKS